MTDTTVIEATTFRSLLDHLHPMRPYARNPDLMIIAGFCRHGLAGWYRKVFEATPDQVRVFEAARARLG